MSSYTQFSPKFTEGQIRYLANESDSIPGYLKCDGSIVSQATYPELYSAVGLLPNNLDFTPIANSSGVVTNTVIYGGGQYVRAGAGGSLATSPDGITWTARTSGTANSINELIYAGGQYVFVANSGIIGRSSDGVTWATTTTPSFTFNMLGVSYGGGLYLAVGVAGVAYTSPDAVTWTYKPTGTASTLYSAAYGLGYFVVATATGFIISTDGNSWTSVTSDSRVGPIYSIAFGNNLFVASDAYGTILTFSNPVSPTINAQKPFPIVGQRVRYNNGLFLYTGWRTSAAAFVFVSTDGFSWMQLNSNISNTVYDLCYDTKMVIVGPANLLATNVLYTYNTSTEFALPKSVTIPNNYVQYTANNMAAHIKVK